MNRNAWWGPVLLLLAGVLVLGGTREPLPSPPETAPTRIVSLAPSLTEIIVALGAGDRLVGVTQYCEVDDSVARIGGLKFDFEAILTAQPDRVFAIETRSQANLLAALAGRGIPVEILPAETIADLTKTLEVLGRRLGAVEVSRRLSREIASALRPPSVDPLPAMFVVQRQPLMVAGGGSFVDEMLRAAGLVNVFTAESWRYRRVELETVISRDPVLILDASFDGTDPQVYWSRFDRLEAVRTNSIAPFPPVRPGLKIPAWIAQLRGEAERQRRRRSTAP